MFVIAFFVEVTAGLIVRPTCVVMVGVATQRVLHAAVAGLRPMDPTANLEEQLLLADEILREDELYNTDVIRLAELVVALHEWQLGGGFAPNREKADRSRVMEEWHRNE